MSSSQLTAAIARAGSTKPVSRTRDSGQRTAATIEAQVVTDTIAMPPPRGVTRVWLDREFGTSNTPWLVAQPISQAVATEAAAAATRNQAA